MAVTNAQIMKKLEGIEAKIDGLKPKQSGSGLTGMNYPHKPAEPVSVKWGNLVRPDRMKPLDYAGSFDPRTGKPFTPVTWAEFKKLYC